MTAPVVSVVLPVYNAAHAVEAAVSSVLGQRLRELELIIVDDGSTDGTDSVLRLIDDPRLVVVRHPKNRGYVAAVRTGIEHTSTDIVARMDADDVAHQDRLAREYELLQQRPEVGLVATGFVSVDEHGQELRRHEPPPDHGSAWFRLLFANCLAHPTTMYRRAVFDAVGGYRDDCFPADDHDLWLRMAEVTEIATISDALLWYQQADSSMSVQLHEAMDDASVGVSARVLERIIGHRPSERILRGLRSSDPVLECRDVHEMLDVVLPAYLAIRRACRARGISTRRLRKQLAPVLLRGGLRGPDGTWCPAGIARLIARRPRTAGVLAFDRIAARSRPGTRDRSR